MGDRKMGHVQSWKVYTGVLLGLFFLTFVTVWVSYFDFGWLNPVVAVFVAGVKATLVVLFFMHGRFEGKITWAFIWYPLILLGILLGGLFLDYGARTEGKMGSLGPTDVQSITVVKPKDKHHGDKSGDHGKTEDHDGTTAEDHGASEEEADHTTDGDQSETGEQSGGEEGGDQGNESGND